MAAEDAANASLVKLRRRVLKPSDKCRCNAYHVKRLRAALQGDPGAQDYMRWYMDA